MPRLFVIVIAAAISLGTCSWGQAQIIRRNIIRPGGIVDQVRNQVRDVIPVILRPLEQRAPGAGILRPATPGDHIKNPSGIYAARAQLSPNQSVLVNPNVLPGNAQAQSKHKTWYQPDPSAIYFDRRTGQYYYRVSQRSGIPKSVPAQPKTDPAKSPENLKGPPAQAQPAEPAETPPVADTVPLLEEAQLVDVDPLSDPKKPEEDQPNFSVLQE